MQEGEALTWSPSSLADGNLPHARPLPWHLSGGDGILEAASSPHHSPVPALAQEVLDSTGLKHMLVFPSIPFPTTSSCPSSQGAGYHPGQDKMKV